MQPVLTPDEMAAVDAAAPEGTDVLIERAGFAVARRAIAMMGGMYGRRVSVVCGKGNNGRDGLVAARLLAARGVSVKILDAADPQLWDTTIGGDLLIDAAYGTGFRGSYSSPRPGSARVLAVDIVSGLSAVNGEVVGHPHRADDTVTFGALSPGHLFGSGPEMSGRITIEGIGLDVTSVWGADAPLRCTHIERSDLAALVPVRSPDAHKWKSAVWVVGGSRSMMGAPILAARAAFASGAGYVRLSSPGLSHLDGAPIESVTVPTPLVGWHRSILEGADRVRALVVGPGLGREESVAAEVTALAGAFAGPMVIDGDGLWAISSGRGRISEAPRILTPHDGEYTQLMGHPPGDDRIDATRRLAAERRCVVLLKGPTTVIADPFGTVRLVTSGDQRLASAGTGDVLSGIIAGLLAGGASGFDAAVAGAYVHGLAATRCPMVGTTASQLAAPVSEILSSLHAPARSGLNR